MQVFELVPPFHSITTKSLPTSTSQSVKSPSTNETIVLLENQELNKKLIHLRLSVMTDGRRSHDNKSKEEDKTKAMMMLRF